MAKRTNKQERLAYNFTKMAAYIQDIRWNHEFQEAAKDAGLAMIDMYWLELGSVNQQYVFVPQKEWDLVNKRALSWEKTGIGTAKEVYVQEAAKWYHKARIYD